MSGGPVVLLGQGEQYDDPHDWAELVRARRIRRGVELAVRRDGLTTLIRPEEAPELAAVLDAVDPPLTAPPPTLAAAAPPSPAAHPLAAPAPQAVAGTGGSAVPPTPGASPPGRVPTARPRRTWRFGVWRWVIGGGVLLLLRLCATNGFGPLPAFGDRAEPTRPAACAHARGWISQAACEDPALARQRTAMARAYTRRAAGLDGEARDALAESQKRWQASRESCRRAADPGACLEPLYRRRLAELEGG